MGALVDGPMIAATELLPPTNPKIKLPGDGQTLNCEPKSTMTIA
jgi:hypothetical protein